MIKFGYYSAPINSRKGYVTVAITRPEKDDPQQNHFASFAFCSPKDQFRKSQGRLMAEGRLNAQKNMVQVQLTGSIPKVIEAAMLEAIQSKKVPSWVSRAFRKGVLQYGLR